MNGAEAFVKSLEAEEVEYIFAIPGEENLDFLEALRHSSIKLIVTRHEQAAGFMAATYGRLTGKPGVCLSTLGPGATNLVTAAAYAQLGGMPMVMITGQKPIKTSKQGQFQIVDVVGMMHPITKYSAQIASAHTVPAKVREAFRLAETERPGAAHLELPEDIAREETQAHTIHNSFDRRPLAENKAIEKAIELIETSKHPLILIGAGANRKRVSNALNQFIDNTQIPFFTTQMGKGVIDERHPLFLGTAALSDNDFVHSAIRNTDLIINVGHDVVEKPPFFMKPDGFKVIHINYLTAAIDPVYFPQVDVTGDISHTIYQLAQGVNPQAAHVNWNFDRFMTAKQAIEKDISESAKDDRFPVYPQKLVQDIRKALPEKGIIALDNGIYKIWFARNYPAYHHNTVLLDNALATMGAGLPSAMAAKLVHPNRPVIAISGDGGFMMNSQELETAVRLQLDLIVLILNDNAYGMIKWKQQAMGMSDFGLDLNNPNFVLYAESYGAIGHQLQSPQQLVPLLEQCLNTPGVHLIEIPIDYSENDEILNHQIKKRSAALFS